MRCWLAVGVLAALVGVTGVASSSSGGRTGKSGKQGSICTSCHQGGITPSVVLEGPTSLDAGTVAVYTFRIDSDAAITGMNAASSDGVLVEDADGGFTRGEDGEIVHARTLRPDSGAAFYSFSLTAPAFGGTVTLFAAGNACNDNGQTDGDQAASTKLEIAVNGPPRPPPPPPPSRKPPPPLPPDDGGTDAGSDAGAAPIPDEDSGCAIGWADRSSTPTGAILGAIAAIAAIARRRRQRSR